MMRIWLRWMSVLVILVWLSSPGMASARRERRGSDLVEIADEGPVGSGPEIHLNAGTFDPLAESGLKIAGLEALSAVEEDAATTYLLQFTGPVRETWKTQVAVLGVRLYTYVPDYAFIVRLDAKQIDAVRDLSFVRWVGVYQPAYRLSETLRAVASSTSKETTTLEDPLAVTVQALPDADLDALALQIEALGGKVTRRAQRMTASVLRVEIAPATVPDIAGLDEVLWVEPYLPPALLNDVGGGAIMRANDVRSSLGLYGEGQIVGVADSGLDVGATSSEMSDDFEGRIAHAEATCKYFDLRTTWNDFDGHGTHVAGSVLGNGVNSGSTPGTHQYDSSFAGVAPEAQLVFQAVDDQIGNGLECIPVDLDTYLFGVAYSEGARVHTNSWGGPTGGTSENPEYGGYDDSSEAADLAAWNRKDLLILFAAGNSGIDANSDGFVDPDSMGSPGTAKNVLTVGATESLRESVTSATWGGAWAEDFPANPIFSDHMADNQDGMAAFSSRGPTDDGRIKPEVAAPGTFIISTRSHDPNAGAGWGEYDADYLYMGGTSMATPLTAGGAAVVREWLVKQGGVSNPSAALLKAMLINGAADMSPGQYASPQEIPAQRPNSVAGWGRVDLLETVAPSGDRSLWYTDTTTGLSTGNTADYPLTLAGGDALRVTLAWVDYPGSPTAGRQLVNDLDLEVIGPSASYYGNSGAYATGDGCLRDSQWDQCNNVESVILPSAAAGSYTVRVHAQNVPNGPQPFALAASAHFGAPNAGPTLSGLPDQTVNVGQTLDDAIDLHTYADDAEDDDTDLTFSIVSSLPPGLDVQIDGNRYVDITATVGFAGAVPVEIQVEDTGGLTASDIFTVTANTGPSLAGLPDQMVSTAGWDHAIDLHTYADDAEDDDTDLTFSIASQMPMSVGASIDANRYVDIQPLSGYTGTAQVQVLVADTGGLTATDTFEVEVTEANIPPELTLEDVTMEVSQTLSIDLWPYVTDRNDPKETLTFTIRGVSDESLTATIVDPDAHYLYLEPFGGWMGTAQVEIGVEDTSNATATDILTVTVVPPNTGPTLSGLPDQTVRAGQTEDNAIDLWAYAADAEDADADLTFSLLGSPPADAGVSIDSQRYIDISPDVSYEGTVAIEVQVQDTGSLTATDTFTLTVQPGGLIYLPLVTKNWPPIPHAPTLNAITPNPSTDGSYTVSWSAGSGPAPTSYDIEENGTIIQSNYAGASRSFSGKSNGTYTYRVRGRNSYGAGSWSTSRQVSVQIPSGPKPGFWQDTTTGTEFSVTTNRAYVDNFAIYISVQGCGNYKITHTPQESISNDKFSFSGPFYANGTFNSNTTSSGRSGLSEFYIDGCGTVSGGPWSWSASWQHSRLSVVPAEVVETDAVMPVERNTNFYTVNPLKESE
jgi:subtilisin family serine protease